MLTNPTFYPFCGNSIDSKYRALAEEIMAQLPGFSLVRRDALVKDCKHIDCLLSYPKPFCEFLANIALARGAILRWRRTVSNLKVLSKKTVLRAF